MALEREAVSPAPQRRECCGGKEHNMRAGTGHSTSPHFVASGWTTASGTQLSLLPPRGLQGRGHISIRRERPTTGRRG